MDGQRSRPPPGHLGCDWCARRYLTARKAPLLGCDGRVTRGRASEAESYSQVRDGVGAGQSRHRPSGGGTEVKRSTEKPEYPLVRAWLSQLTGTVLEIGAGYGTNFAELPGTIRWVGLEPDRRLHRRLTRSANEYGHLAAIVAARAEQIPLRDSSMDAVVATLVLCS